MKFIGGFFTVVITMIVGAIVRGFVFMKLWSWFVVDIFNVKPLNLIEAIGVVYATKRPV